MENKLILSALAMDLKRVALGLHNKSYRTAERFLSEAKKRKQEIDKKDMVPYMQTILENIDDQLDAENALMYSTRIQNYVLSM